MWAKRLLDLKSKFISPKKELNYRIQGHFSAPDGMSIIFVHRLCSDMPRSTKLSLYDTFTMRWTKVALPSVIARNLL